MRERGAGQPSAALLHLQRWSQKWQSGKVVVIHHRHTSGGPSHPSNNDEWRGEERCKGEGAESGFTPTSLPDSLHFFIKAQ